MEFLRSTVHPNLAQYLELTDIDQLWVADITYLRLEQEFAYLAVVLDAYSRRVIGWAASRHELLAGDPKVFATADWRPTTCLKSRGSVLKI